MNIISDHYWCESCSHSFHEGEADIATESIEGVTVRHIRCPSCHEGEGLESAYKCEACGDYYASHVLDDGTCLECVAGEFPAPAGTSFRLWLVQCNADEIGPKVQNDARGKGPCSVLHLPTDRPVMGGSAIASAVVRGLIRDNHLTANHAVAARAGEPNTFWVGWYA